MVGTTATQPRAVPGEVIARLVVGGIWLAGAAFNLLVTQKMADPYGWLAEGSHLPIYRWFFGEVVSAHPTIWTVALAIGEAAIGVLTLCRGGWARLGLAGGVLVSTLLFTLATPSTLVMGRYALALVWLRRRTDLLTAAGPVRLSVSRRMTPGAAA